MTDSLDRQYRVLIDHSPDAVVVHEGRALVFANPAALRLIGATEPTQVVGHPMTEFVDMGSTTALFERIAALDGLGAASVPTSMVLRRLDGVAVEVESRSVLTVWEARPAYLVVLRDMTAQRAAEAAKAMSERQFTTVVENLVEGVIVLDGAGVVQSINPAACTILGVHAGDVVEATGDRTLAHVLGTATADGDVVPPVDYPHVRAQRDGRPASFVNRIRRPDGTEVWIRGTTQVLDSGRKTRLVVSFTDTTEERRATDRLEYQATHDSMTDLPNRMRVVDALRAALADPGRGPLAVFFMDLDNLKTINDSLGHSVGDSILQEVATRLRAVVPHDGIVGRVGGDEFVAVIHGDDGYVSRVSDTIHATLSDPSELDGWTLGITASIGVVTIPAVDTRTIDDLLRDADLAMYEAKGAGGERTVRFTSRLRRSVPRD